MQTDLMAEREQASSLQRGYAAQIATIRADRNLSDDGRNRALVDLWRRTRDELDRLRQREQSRLATRQRELELRLFTPTVAGMDVGARIISTRDAHDRVDRLARAAEAAALLERAERARDEVLSCAIAQRAVEQSRVARSPEVAAGWDDVLAAFVDARPQFADTIEELAAIERALQPQLVLGPYSVPKPGGVPTAFFNTGVPAAFYNAGSAT